MSVKYRMSLMKKGWFVVIEKCLFATCNERNMRLHIRYRVLLSRGLILLNAWRENTRISFECYG